MAITVNPLFTGRAINPDISSAQSIINNFKNTARAASFKASLTNMSAQKVNFASQLLDRIKDPWKISQGSSSLCGPAAFIYCLCKDAPHLYAQYAIDLYTKGKATIGKLDLKPSSGFLNSNLDSGISVVDWVTLAGLRDASNTFLNYDQVSDEAAGISLPNNLVHWFKQAGYNTVKDVTNVFANKGTSNLLDAQKGYRAKKTAHLFPITGWCSVMS